MGNQEKLTHEETINERIYSKCLYKEIYHQHSPPCYSFRTTPLIGTLVQLLVQQAMTMQMCTTKLKIWGLKTFKLEGCVSY